MSSSIYQLQNGSRKLAFSQPRIMGVLNCTPDSFFEGSRAASAKAAVETGQRMLAAGADLYLMLGASRPVRVPWK